MHENYNKDNCNYHYAIGHNGSCIIYKTMKFIQ